jgi:hypothetical protein
MKFTAKKYKFSATFCHENRFSVKKKVNNFGFFGQKLIFSKPLKFYV